MPIGRINSNLYTQRWRRAKCQGWHRSWPNRSSVDVWWRQYCFRQRLAEKSEWNFEKWDECLSSLRKDLKQVRINPIPVSKAPSAFSDLGASAGLGFSGRKEYLNKGEIPMSEVYKMWDILKRGQIQLIPDYSIAFRSHLVKRGDPPKARVVLVSPGALAMVEKCWAEPFYHELKAISYPRPWATGFDWFSGDGARILQTFGPKSLSMDFSSFDTSAPCWMIRDVFRLMAECFSMTSEESSVLDTIMKSHCFSWAKNGRRRFKLTGGIRTGSSFTHIVGTMVCILMVRYLTSPDIQSVSYGDDCIVNTTVPLNVICERAEKTSSFQISKQKSKYGIHWLGLQYKGRKWEVENEDKRWGQMFNPEYVGDCEDLQAQLLHSHLLAAGTGKMAQDIRQIIAEAGVSALFPALERSLEKCVYLPLGIRPMSRASNIFLAEQALKMHMET